MENKNLLIIVGVAILCGGGYWFIQENNKKLETEIEEVSYIIGSNIALGNENQIKSINKELKAVGIDTLDANALARAFKDVAKGNELLISEEEGSQIMEAFSKKMIAKTNELQTKANEKEANYLVKNAEKEGVITTESGLQYEILTSSGSNIKPNPNSEVTVHYHATLIDGTVFDSSIERGEPTTFPINGIIAGWQEALQLMSVGDKWKLTIPGKIAYGQKGVPQVGIGPDATLIFEVELLSIK